MATCLRCPHHATSLLTYDHAGACAFLDDARGDEPMYQGLRLCEHHAGRFTPPLGWSLVDRRTIAPGLFPVGEG